MKLKTKVTLVVAMNKDRVIGVNNQLPWHIPEDLAYFKEVTLGKPIIMGRKTFESIGRVLPGRRNIVITRNSDWHYAGVEVVSSIDEALSIVNDSNEVCVIGGGEIFKQTLPIANSLHISMVDIHVDAPSAFFPELVANQWTRVSHKEIITKNDIKCSYNEYIRK